MTGMLGRRLTRLETEAVIGVDLPVIFVSFVGRDGTDPPATSPRSTAAPGTVNWGSEKMPFSSG